MRRRGLGSPIPFGGMRRARGAAIPFGGMRKGKGAAVPFGGSRKGRRVGRRGRGAAGAMAPLLLASSLMGLKRKAQKAGRRHRK